MFCGCDLGSVCLLMLLSLYQVLDLNFFYFIYLFSIFLSVSLRLFVLDQMCCHWAQLLYKWNVPVFIFVSLSVYFFSLSATIWKNEPLTRVCMNQRKLFLHNGCQLRLRSQKMLFEQKSYLLLLYFLCVPALQAGKEEALRLTHFLDALLFFIQWHTGSQIVSLESLTYILKHTWYFCRCPLDYLETAAL